MPSKFPLISVVLPVYNREGLIVRTISSVINQTFSNWELIVVDDGSTDKTKEKVLNISDERVNYYFKENEERSIARNFGIDKAKGKYIAFIDSDDLWRTHHLQSFVDLIDADSSTNFIVADYNFGGIEFRFNAYYMNHTLLAICENNKIGPPMVLVEKKLLDCYRFPSSKSFVFAEDLYVWIQLLKVTKASFTKKVTVDVLSHVSNSMNTVPPNTILFSLEEIIKLMHEFPGQYSNQMEQLMRSNLLSLAALYASLSNQRLFAIKLLLKSIISYPKRLFRRRNLATIKYLLKP